MAATNPTAGTVFTEAELAQACREVVARMPALIGVAPPILHRAVGVLVLHAYGDMVPPAVTDQAKAIFQEARVVVDRMAEAPPEPTPEPGVCSCGLRVSTKVRAMQHLSNVVNPENHRIAEWP